MSIPALLNPAQREATAYLDGPCLVIAGAGSGKTRVITQKIVHLIDSGLQPTTIAAITFTNKAAQEMAERLHGLVKLPREQQPLVCTFHSLGVRILRRDGRKLGLKAGFSIIDSDDALGILLESLATTDRKLGRIAASRISLWKNALIEPDEAAATATDRNDHTFARAYRDYAATLNAYQSVDFDDLIRLPVLLFRGHPETLGAWREKLRYLLVDEYQDTNTCQYELLRQLAGPRAAFTAVGDDDQSIYGWRGATLENLQRLGTDYPQLKVIKLEQNYRSSVSILTAANHLIERNPKLYPKRLWSDHGIGDPVLVIGSDNEEQEAESVVMRLQAHKFERRGNFADYAVLYRGNHQSRVFEQVLRKERIPYVLSGGQSFFERAEIRDLIAYLRLLVNDDDDPAFIRAITVPKRGVGTATLQALGSYAGQRQQSMFAALFETGLEQKLAARQLQPLREFGEFIRRIGWRASREPAAQVLDDLLAAIDYRAHLYDTLDDKAAASRWQNVSDFIDWLKKRIEQSDTPAGGTAARQAAGRGSTLLELAQTVSLLSQLDRKEGDTDAIRLTTIHASKGLEFPHVFIVGCEEGLLPHRGDEVLDEPEETPKAAQAAPASAPKRAAASAPSSVTASAVWRPTAGPPAAGGSARQAVHVTPRSASEVRIEEERRLMYVAVTRAQRSLWLSWCKARKRARELERRQPSRFIAEMQLDARPATNVMISDDAAKLKLDALRAMLSAKGRRPG